MRAKLEKRSFSSQGRLLPRHWLHPHACDTGPRTLCAPRIPSSAEILEVSVSDKARTRRRHHSPCRHNNSRPAKTCRAAQSADASSPASRGAQTDHFACLLSASLLQPAQRTWRPATAHLVHSTKLQAAQRMWRPATARLVHCTKLQE